MGWQDAPVVGSGWQSAPLVEEPAPQSTSQPPQEEPRDLIKRMAGLNARSVIEGGLSLPGVVAGGVGGLYNVAADLGTPPGASYVSAMRGEGKSTPASGPIGTFRFKDPMAQLSQSLTQAGLPQPQGWKEKLADVGTQMLAGSALTPPMGALSPGRAPLYESPFQSARVSPQDYTRVMGGQMGLVLPPSAKGTSTGLTNVAEGFAGKAALRQEASIQNQEVVTNVLKRVAGLRPEDDLTKATLAEAQQKMAQPYRDVAKLSKTAASALDEWKTARADAKLWWNSFNRSAHPDSLAKARAFDSEAALWESVIESEAAKAGDPGLIARLQAAKVAIAQSKDVERSLVGDQPSAAIIARLVEKGGRTGDLKTIGDFARTNRLYMQSGPNVPQPGVSALNPVGSAIYSMAGNAVAGVPGAITGAAIPLGRGFVRRGLLSPPAQTAPVLGPGLLAPLVAGEEAIRQW